MYELDIYEPHYGSCDKEKPKYRRLVVNHDINTQEGLDTLIHESIHAICPKLPHSIVDRLANYLSKLLWTLGYRRG